MIYEIIAIIELLFIIYLLFNKYNYKYYENEIKKWNLKLNQKPDYILELTFLKLKDSSEIKSLTFKYWLKSETQEFNERLKLT